MISIGSARTDHRRAIRDANVGCASHASEFGWRAELRQLATFLRSDSCGFCVGCPEMEPLGEKKFRKVAFVWLALVFPAWMAIAWFTCR